MADDTLDVHNKEGPLSSGPLPFGSSAAAQILDGRRRQGFSLLELLVVIGMLVVLIGILLPVIDGVRRKARATSTVALIKNLSEQIEAYHHDFKAYPGPIPNTQLRTPLNGVSPFLYSDVPPQPYISYTPLAVTMAENLVLGLVGGLKPGGAPGMFTFAYNLVGEGPRTLGATSKKLPAYGYGPDEVSRDRLEVSGLVRSGTTDEIFDSQIPEYLDRFPDRLPLLYLRARPGKPGVIGTAPNAPAPGQQYDLSQILPYTTPDRNGNSLGEGRTEDGEVRVLPAEAQGNPRAHGFIAAPVTTATLVPDSPGFTYPYNIHAALRHRTIPNTPRQKDGYILISAGLDRIYGTKDDLTNFGSYGD